MLKQSSKFVGMNTNTGVFNMKGKIYSLIVHTQEVDPDKNFSLVRKLYCITHQVNQHLSYSVGIPYNLRRDVVIDLIDKVELFLRRVCGKKIQHSFYTGAEIKFFMIEFKFPGFDFRKIKNIVYHL